MWKGDLVMASEKSNTLYKELLKRGFHEELCKEIAFKYMNTDYTACLLYTSDAADE